MSDWLLPILKAHPEVTFFLVLGLGYLLGKVKIGSFTLGAVTGTLLAGVVLGQWKLEVSGDVQQSFFVLFLFSIGFRTGPQFFRGLRSEGLRQAGLAATVATAGLVAAYAVSRLFGYDAGTAAGLVAGSLTESATIGTALDAIRHLPVPAMEQSALANRIPVAFAVTYLIGVMGAAWFLAQVAPKILGIDLAEECRKLEQEMGGGSGGGMTLRREFEMRAYRMEAGSRLAGRTVGEVEEEAGGERLFIERYRRGEQVSDAGSSTALREGDTIAVTGRRELLAQRLDAAKNGLREVDDRELLDIPGEALDVVVTNREADGRTIRELAGEEAARGVFLRRITRAGTPVAMLGDVVVQRGDVLTLVGPARRTAAAAEALGFADRATDAADVLVVAFGIVAGALTGVPSFLLGGVEIGLGTSVGVLLGGLICGWLRSVRPGLLGRIPGPTLWIFESIGLSGFVAVVGLKAGPDFVAGLRASGPTLVLAGLVTILTPLLIGVLAGKYVFRLHPGVSLGVCAGGCTATPALAAIQEAAKSAVPTLGYGVAYAVGNVLLALWGSVMVALLAGR